ncbi:MAG: phosphate-starvation-inducible protein PsiF [Betaproteobacteria bacterium]|nr:phosphate-starvation-inducible protein PsiF [Betaproteobacteria bacterium]
MKLALAALCSLALVSLPAIAQDKKEPSEAQKKQQARMKDCNEQAATKGVKGDERKAFMSSCLKGDTNAKGEKMTEQQSKMKACNKQAGDKKLKGDERKKFMSECLKG